MPDDIDETLLSADRLLTTEKAAQAVGYAPRTLEDLRWRGGGPPYVKLSGAVRYDPQDLRDWIEDRKVRDTTDADVDAGEAA